jgi:hypothetical protein
LSSSKEKRGKTGLDIPLDLRVMAAKAARRPAPLNKSVLDAAFYASYLERESSSMDKINKIEQVRMRVC